MASFPAPLQTSYKSLGNASKLCFGLPIWKLSKIVLSQNVLDSKAMSYFIQVSKEVKNVTEAELEMVKHFCLHELFLKPNSPLRLPVLNWHDVPSFMPLIASIFCNYKTYKIN